MGDDYSPITAFRDEYAFLSNFYTGKPLNVFGRTFKTGEAAFQGAKGYAAAYYGNTSKYLDRAASADTPGLAKYYGRSFVIHLDTWDGMKVERMADVLWAKFTQDSALGDRLVATGPRMLIEGNDWGDTFWGRSGGKGDNILGVLLMELRGKLK